MKIGDRVKYRGSNPYIRGLDGVVRVVHIRSVEVYFGENRHPELISRYGGRCNSWRSNPRNWVRMAYNPFEQSVQDYIDEAKKELGI